SEIVLAREEQRDVDGHAGEDRFLDGGEHLRRAGNLDEEIGTARARMQFLRDGQRRLGVVREKRRNLERYISVDTSRAIEHRTEKVGGARDVLERELEEQRFAGLAGPKLRADTRRLNGPRL